MSTDLSNLALVCGVAAAVNIVSAIDKRKDLVPVIVGSCVAFAGLAIVGGLSGRWELPVAFAWVFLLAALVFRGLPLVQKSGLLARTTKSNPIVKTSTTYNGKNERRDTNTYADGRVSTQTYHRDGSRSVSGSF